MFTEQCKFGQSHKWKISYEYGGQDRSYFVIIKGTSEANRREKT